MIKLAANLTTMFQEQSALADRGRAASRCGFRAVEILNPYDHDAQDIRRWLDEYQLTMILLNINPGQGGEAGTAAIPGRESHFRESMQQAIAYASVTNVPMIHVLAGRSTDTVHTKESLFIDHLKWAADEAAQHQVTLNLEPLNKFDVPDYLHSTTEQTAELIRRINRENVGMQFDFYHLQRMQGDLARAFRDHQSIISHVQLSSVPGRHEPQHGEVNAHFLLDEIDSMGYSGWVGCEYWPKAGTLEGLHWAERYGIKASPE